jgi:hypothetical protein
MTKAHFEKDTKKKIETLAVEGTRHLLTNGHPVGKSLRNYWGCLVWLFVTHSYYSPIR